MSTLDCIKVLVYASHFAFRIAPLFTGKSDLLIASMGILEYSVFLLGCCCVILGQPWSGGPGRPGGQASASSAPGERAIALSAQGERRFGKHSVTPFAG